MRWSSASPSRPTGGDPGREEGGPAQHRRHQTQGQRIVRPDAEEQRPERPGQQQRQDHARRDAQARQEHALLHQHQVHLDGAGSQGQPHPDLPGTEAHGVGHHAVDADDA